MLNFLKKLSPFSSKTRIIRENNAEKSTSSEFNFEDLKLGAKKTTQRKNGACGFDLCGLYCGCCEDMCGC